MGSPVFWRRQIALFRACPDFDDWRDNEIVIREYETVSRKASRQPRSRLGSPSARKGVADIWGSFFLEHKRMNARFRKSPSSSRHGLGFLGVSKTQFTRSSSRS